MPTSSLHIGQYLTIIDKITNIPKQMKVVFLKWDGELQDYLVYLAGEYDEDNVLTEPGIPPFCELCAESCIQVIEGEEE